MEFREENDLQLTENGSATTPEADGNGAPNQPLPLFQERKYYISITCLFVALAILLTFVITYVILTENHKEELEELEGKYETELDYYGEFRSIIELYYSLPEEMRNIETYKKLAYIDCYYRTNYIGEINEDELVYMVANGYILGAGDLYGEYYSADEFKTVVGEYEGSSVGIGVYITYDYDTDGVRISYVMKDGPAHEAGLLPGDVITHVDGKRVSDIGYYSATDLIKGAENTTVKVIVLRDGKYIEKTLTRKLFTAESVIYKKHETEAGVGIIRIVEFDNATTGQFISAVEQAIEVDGCTKLIFDVRSNPGGTIDSVIEILDFMLPEGVIVTQRYANGEEQEYMSDNEGEEFEKLYGTDVEMAVLVNGNSASAAELFTCALKDYGKAVIVGEKTYGKGCGQNVIPLYDGSGFVFTTFLYDPPKSENYNDVGITPDVSVSLSEEADMKNLFELLQSEDEQLKAAVEALNK